MQKQIGMQTERSDRQAGRQAQTVRHRQADSIQIDNFRLMDEE
jgi:hypothetical protein